MPARSERPLALYRTCKKYVWYILFAPRSDGKDYRPAQTSCAEMIPTAPAGFTGPRAARAAGTRQVMDCMSSGEMTSRPAPPIRVGLVLAAFPREKETAFKYFLLLLNRLQKTFEFAFYEPPENDPFIRLLGSGEVLDADETRGHLLGFAELLRRRAEGQVREFDLSSSYPAQIVIISLATLSNYHFLIRRKHVSLLALGEWDRSMAPPSAAEFLQVAVLRAAYSALEGGAWNSIHLGTRGCIFDFTANLEDTRFMTLTGLGVCEECERALKQDGMARSSTEIREVVNRSWLGARGTPGTPANIMAQFGYDLFLTKGFTSTLRERVRQLLEEDAAKELIKIIFAVILAGLVFWLGWKK